MSHDPNEMMLELFRAEVESHSESLSSALLKLEQDSTATALLDGMMRAAHSIKGAARIVRVEPAVEVAHAMEDCFVAAQRGELVLDPSGIDVMLRSVDLLVQISEASKNAQIDWAPYDAIIASTVEQLRCVLHRQPISEIAPQALPQVLAAPTADSAASVAPEESVAELPAPSTPLHLSFALPSKLDSTQAELLRQKLLAASRSDPNQPIVLDALVTQSMDAVGFAFLHSVAQWAIANQSALQIINASSELVRALSTIGVAASPPGDTA